MKITIDRYSKKQWDNLQLEFKLNPVLEQFLDDNIGLYHKYLKESGYVPEGNVFFEDEYMIVKNTFFFSPEYNFKRKLLTYEPPKLFKRIIKYFQEVSRNRRIKKLGLR